MDRIIRCIYNDHMNDKSAPPPHPLADLHCTCYRLRKATRRVTAMYDEALAPVGMTVTQFSILAMVALTGPRPMSTLADALGMEPSTLTRTLKPLIERGDLVVEPGEDRRVKNVAITDAGKHAAGLAVPYWREAQRRVERALGGEVAQLHALLRKVSAVARAVEPGSADSPPADKVGR
ncbi:DNA-binding MarR family transcriptional regulator [Tepidamorphus gemmatus]|uniref:DNA-binding MarR family transcriptional regulator n=2 Tax=Tepidamorphus gemmatus TaxID=747076 RepID=A0A4R3MCQ6_9HYPH|nr:DNA-binding MarR family transcriptional regulator [Tepidamorphus gemmatus]